ncbi:hypothetical protein Tco_0828593 [Tanacetum coccineum]
MPVWCCMFQHTLDGNAKGWFECLPFGSIDEWADVRMQFTTKFSTRRACFKDPTEITKIVRKEKGTLIAFKERWMVETGFILGVLKIMKISSLMNAHKCPELAKQYSNKVLKTLDEMMVRLDDFVRSEEAFAITELLKGELSEPSKKASCPINIRDDRFHKGGYKADRRRNEGQNTYNNREGLTPYRPRDYQAPYHSPREDLSRSDPLRLNLNSLTKHPKEILLQSSI